MPHMICFATPPMLARRLRQDIEAAFPDHRLSPPSTHLEMFEAAHGFAQPGGEPAEVTISAYPQLLERIWHDGAPAADLSGLNVPPLRRAWTELGLVPPVPSVAVVAVVPLVLAVHRDLAPVIRDWDDLKPLTREPGTIGAPPEDTPLPFLLSAFLGARWGVPEAALRAAFDRASPPLDINKRVARGELAVGLLPPAFCRSFREGDAVMVWPESGALAVPVMAAVSPDAPASSYRALAFLLSREMQALFAESGGMAPAVPGAPGFAELDAADWRMLWPGWEAFVELGRTMTAHLARGAIQGDHDKRETAS